MNEPLSPATRYLLLIGELHKVGFERLRFVAGGEQYMRVHAYAACNEEKSKDGWSVPELVYSMEMFGNALPKQEAKQAALRIAWQARLESELRPRHLVGQFVLDFPKFVKPAYGADQAYAHWFRQLVPYLLKGYHPRMYGDPYDDTPPGFFQLSKSGDMQQFPDPPPNPFKNLVGDDDNAELQE